MNAGRFPVLESDAVDGTRFTAPSDLGGAYTVALVGFAIEQRAQVESWGAFLDELVRSTPTVRARLFVALGRGMRVMRGLVYAALRKALPAPELRASTIPVFVDLDAFCAELGIADRAQLAVLLLAPDSSVLMHASGGFDVAVAGAIERALS